eukprot:9490783-Pyramimonas_sp.AAC.1
MRNLRGAIHRLQFVLHFMERNPWDATYGAQILGATRGVHLNACAVTCKNGGSSTGCRAWPCADGTIPK